MYTGFFVLILKKFVTDAEIVLNSQFNKRCWDAIQGSMLNLRRETDIDKILMFRLKQNDMKSIVISQTSSF